MRHIALTLAAVLMLASCSSDNKRAEEATSLLDQARTLTESKQYGEALVLLDTLDVKYRDCLDQRREGTSLRLSALAGMNRDSIASDELQLRAVTAVLDSLGPDFRKVDIAGTEGFYVDKSVYTGSEMNSTGIQVRVDEQGYCFVVANLSGRRIGLDAIAYGEVRATGQSLVVEGSEIMSIGQEGAAQLVEALADAPGKAVVTLSGPKGSANVTLNEKQIKSIRNTWLYAQALQKSRALSIRLEKLERQLAKLNEQLAGQMTAPEN